MNFKKAIFLLTILFTGISILFGQDEKIKYLEHSYNFGTINEKGDQVTHRFLFVNEGDKAIKIKTAKASCGCTTPFWYSKPVFPGDTGYVEARYNPKNRPGKFNKNVTMFLENSTYSEKFFITGYSQPPLTSAFKTYKVKVGNLRFKNINFNMGTIKKDEPLEKIFTVYNDGNDPLTLKTSSETPKNIKLVFEPKTIKSKEIGNIRLTYDASSTEGFGQIKEALQINSDDTLNPIKNIVINANIREFFTDSLKSDPNRPILSLSTKDKYLGSVIEGEAITYEIIFSNTGKNDLLIRDVYTSCDCIATRSKVKKLKTGKEGKIKVTFDSSGKSSYVQNKITLITNDPNAPIQSVALRAKVTPKTTK